MDTSPREVDERYRIIERIGSGAASDVYKAEHKLLGETVAIKVLKKEQLDKQSSIERFQQEARLAMRLEHPSIARVKGFGKSPQGEPFIVMEYLQGETLESLLAKNSPHGLPAATCISLGKEIAAALAHAHELGVVHRDIKPSNILLQAQSGNNGSSSKTQVRILDFGVAKDLSSTEAAGNLTRTTMLIGTPAYMSPEQCRGQQVGAASDIYSLAVVLYECFTGHKLFEAESDLAVMNMHVNEPVLFRTSDKLSSAVKTILVKCLAKNPEDRYQSAQELLNALESVKSAAPSAKGKFSKAIAALAALLILLSGAIVFYSRFKIQQAPQPQASTQQQEEPVDPTIDTEHKVHISKSDDPEYLMKKAKEAKGLPHTYWPQIIADLKQCRKVALKQGRTSYAALAQKELADVYVLIKRDELAIETYREALKGFKSEEDKPLKMACYQGLGSAYQRLQDYAAAYTNHKLALDNTPDQDLYGHCVNRRLCCGDLILAKRFDEALRLSRSSLAEIGRIVLPAPVQEQLFNTAELNRGKLRANLGHFREQVERREQARAKSVELLFEKGNACHYLAEIGYALKNREIVDEACNAIIEEPNLTESLLGSMQAICNFAKRAKDYEVLESMSRAILNKLKTPDTAQVFWKQAEQNIAEAKKMRERVKLKSSN